VRIADIPALVRAGMAAVHLSAKRAAGTRGTGPAVPMGSAAEDMYLVTDPAVVAAARTALDTADRPG
jgi:copper homeostasis protein